MRLQLRFLLVFILIFSFAATSQANVTTYKVKWGDTLSSLLSDKFSTQEILSISREIRKLVPDFRLLKGSLVKFSESSVTLSPNSLTDIAINRVKDDYELDVIKHQVYTVNTVVEGEISSSLVEAVEQSGEDIELAFMLASVYEWEIDFFHALRKGDSFRVLVEKKFAKDKFIGYGKILAADFINQGRLIRALYYENDKTRGYYSPEGVSLKKGFSKAPLRYTRISSKYSGRRLHPVTHKFEPHYGVDFAAPTGTPVYATADGKIIDRKKNEYNGNYLKIRHMNGYETFYLHLSGFNKKARVGAYVRQGDLIGYVGATGRATGPHLDYRIRKDGRYLNPMNFKSPEKRLAEAEMGKFADSVAMYERKIDNSYAVRSKFCLLR